MLSGFNCKIYDRDRINNMKAAPPVVGIVTIGSRGDVQPFVALALALKQRGIHPHILFHEAYKDMVLQVCSLTNMYIPSRMHRYPHANT